MSESTRFDRQVRFAPIGEAGQERIQAARVLCVGAGALGGVLAQSLVRAGVGELILVDRDVVEHSNLPRQVLFEAAHAEAGLPKTEAAAETLGRIGGPTRLLAVAAHVDARNLAELAQGCDLLLDGTDNLETRYLINDWSVREGVPWIYAGVVGGAGLVMPVLPGKSACLRCLFPVAPSPGSLPTCDSAGVILPAVGLVASLAAGQALHLLSLEDWRAPDSSFRAGLSELDAWHGDLRQLQTPRDPSCPACAQRNFEYLEGDLEPEAIVLCGRNTVQLPPLRTRPDLERIAGNLPGQAEEVTHSRLFLRFRVDRLRLTLFRDGRALVEGTDDAGRARAALDRAIGR